MKLFRGSEPEETAKSTKNGEVKLTAEQVAIINSKGDIKINAVAGSGKTTTIIEYARTRPAGSKILYLAFNKTVKLEAERKFAAKGLAHVKVETAHSLAYKNVVFQNNYKVRVQGYKTHEVAQLLGLKNTGEKHAEYILANHINKLLSYFCNSNKAKVQELDYLSTINDENSSKFVKAFYQPIEHGARLLLAKMDRGEIEITHDFYLKKFQLRQPQLPYDYILFDEGQDASAAMLDIFLQQKAVKVIVGDTHQQIYGWRYAVNSLEKAHFDTYNLSTSFRFGQDIADLAINILDWKNYVAQTKPVSIKGAGKCLNKQVKATIARTNLGLLLKAIEYITNNKNAKHIYFEGNINSYTYADEGTSLYDVLNLYNSNREGIRDKLVQTMNNIDELEEYIEKTEDVQLAMMLEIVKEYGNNIPKILKTLKEKHTGDEDRGKAEMIFSTVHRCKGMEYDSIELVNDFITESRLQKLVEGKKENEEIIVDKCNEEINLLYVAVTRTKNTISLPEELLPKDFPTSPLIQVIKPKKDVEELYGYRPSVPYNKGKNTNAGTEAKSYSHAQVRQSFKDANRPWTADNDAELSRLFDQHITIPEIAEYLNRKTGAIVARLKKIGLLE